MPIRELRLHRDITVRDARKRDAGSGTAKGDGDVAGRVGVLDVIDWSGASGELPSEVHLAVALDGSDDRLAHQLLLIVGPAVDVVDLGVGHTLLAERVAHPGG